MIAAVVPDHQLGGGKARWNAYMDLPDPNHHMVWSERDLQNFNNRGLNSIRGRGWVLNSIMARIAVMPPPRPLNLHPPRGLTASEMGAACSWETQDLARGLLEALLTLLDGVAALQCSCPICFSLWVRPESSFKTPSLSWLPCIAFPLTGVSLIKPVCLIHLNVPLSDTTAKTCPRPYLEETLDRHTLL